MSILSLISLITAQHSTLRFTLRANIITFCEQGDVTFKIVLLFDKVLHYCITSVFIFYVYLFSHVCDTNICLFFSYSDTNAKGKRSGMQSEKRCQKLSAALILFANVSCESARNVMWISIRIKDQKMCDTEVRKLSKFLKIKLFFVEYLTFFLETFGYFKISIKKY